MADGDTPTPVDAGPSRRRALAAGIAAAVVLLGAVVARTVASDDGDPTTAPVSEVAAADDRAGVVAAASEFATALFTYDHTDLEGARDRVTALSTTEFGTAYAQAFDAGLSATIAEVEATSTVTVRDVLTGEVDDAGTTAVVVLDATVSSTLGTRDLTGAYVRLDLVRTAGEWRVEQVVPLTAEDESLVPVPEGSAPSEPAPTEPPPSASPSP